MIQTTLKTSCKQLSFEKSGETISVEIKLINISPNMEIKKIEDFLNQLFLEAKKEIT